MSPKKSLLVGAPPKIEKGEERGRTVAQFDYWMRGKEGRKERREEEGETTQEVGRRRRRRRRRRRLEEPLTRTGNNGFCLLCLSLSLSLSLSLPTGLFRL